MMRDHEKTLKNISALPARDLWLLGDWENLAAISIGDIGQCRDAADRSAVALYAAIGRLQVGETGGVSELLQTALSGLSRVEVIQTLVASVFITLGRVAKYSGHTKRAKEYLSYASENMPVKEEVSWLRYLNESDRAERALAGCAESFRVAYVNKKVCFIHIPKTGGKSIHKSLLGDSVSWDALAYHKPIFSHRNRNNKYVFSSVRNPFSFYVSLYFFFLDYSHEIKNQMRFISSEFCFSDFLRIITDWRLLKDWGGKRGIKFSERDLYFIQSENDGMGLYTSNYVYMCYDNPSMARLPHADIFRLHDKHSALDAVIRLENLSEDFHGLMERWKIPVLPIGHINTSGHEEWSGYYKDDDMQLVIKKDWLLFKLYYPEYIH